MASTGEIWKPLDGGLEYDIALAIYLGQLVLGEETEWFEVMEETGLEYWADAVN